MRLLTRLCCVLFVALLPLISTSFAPTASASNFNVNNLGDTPDANTSDGLCADANGACTLRAAIQQANADTSADVIGFGVTGTINLTGALPDLSTDVTINGPGASQLTVRRDTGGDYRIFTVRAVTVAISGLTISNGLSGNEETLSALIGAAGQPGGGIFNSGTLTLTDCVVSSNASGSGVSGVVSHGAPGNGGGIHNEGTLTMSHCDVSDNQTGSGVAEPNNSGNPGGNGGGISNGGVLTMTDCTVSNNRTGSGGTGTGNGFSGGWGGGISNFSDNAGHNGTATLTNCNVFRNKTGDGAVSAEGSVNTTSGFGGHGGGIFNGATMRLVRSAVSSNTTGNGVGARLGVPNIAGSGGSGGGVYNTGALTVTNSVVGSNITGSGGVSSGVNCSLGNGGDGGGIASPGGSTLKLSQSTIVFNQTSNSTEPCGRDGFGGGLYGTGKIRSTIVSNNIVRFPNSAREVFGTGTGFESLGYNYIGIGSGCCFTPTDRHGSVSAPGFNLNLDPATLVPLPNSIALDTGLARDIDDQPVDADKRGAIRPFDFPSALPQEGGDNSDIGAFERQATDPTPTPTPAPTPTTVQFSTSSAHVPEGCVQADITITRSGVKDGTTVVSYTFTDSSSDGARQRGDFTRLNGQVTFAPGEDTKTVHVLLSEDAYHEDPESFIGFLGVVSGGQLGSPNVITLTIDDNDAEDGTANPIDDNATFVGQHYHDFLSRHADADGQAFWTARLEECGGDAACLDRKRVDVSAAFFLSIEFLNTGYYVIRANKVGRGDQPGVPGYFDFLRETQEVARDVIVGEPGYEMVLEANKQRYTEQFVQRFDFQTAHGSQTAAQYVDSLFANVGVTPTTQERDAAISAFGAGGTTGQAAALRSIVESGSVYNKLYNPSFVLMQYFGYLRRNPNDPPNTNFDGYNFWLDKLNAATQPGEDARDETAVIRRIRRAEMVRAFLRSTEYRGRFAGDASRGNP